MFLLALLSQILVAGQSQTLADSLPSSRHIHFVPSSFSNKFSLHLAPVLSLRSGDTVTTETIDAAGFDKNGIKRQKGGNPLTGPFYIENALPGDVLAVTLINVSLNRSSAFTTESFVSRSLPKSILKDSKKVRLIRWKLDTLSGYATLDTAYEHLREFRIPLKPFLGCVGVAPSNRKDEILSFFPGPFGGNLDFSGICKSSTLYLPIFHEGAYLYMGDGHAVQGDGEIAGNALETSMDVQFTVRVIKKEIMHLSYPAAEDSLYIMAIGVDKTLDGALKIATSGLLDWLQRDYHLTYEEATQVMSTSIEYTIAEIADPEVEIVAKMRKEILKLIRK